MADTHPLIVLRVIRYLTETAKFDDAAVRVWRVNWFTAGLHAFEQRLQTEADTGEFCHGDNIGLADICLATIRIVLPLFKIEITDTPVSDGIFAACQAHDAFAKAAPLRQARAPT
ncbi:glutathione S-transferase family protein [Acidiphilium sp. MT5]